MTGRDSPSRLLIVGPVPPPVHGMALVTTHVWQRVCATGSSASARLLDTSPESLDRSLTYHLTKVGKLLSAVREIVRWTRSGEKRLYIAVDSGLGMLYTVGFAALGRLLGYPLILHHHSASYIARFRLRAKLLCLAAGRPAVHVVPCDRMAELLQECYRLAQRPLALSNVILVDDPGRQGRQPGRPVVLGHLGNLSRMKGLDLVLEVFRQARRRDLDCRLHLAGPAEPEGGTLIRRGAEEFGDRLQYHGPLYGDDKARFFGGLDVFLFPSRFDEIEGIVNLEAMAHGAIPVAFGHGCIPHDFAEGGGVVIAPGEDYAGPALDLIRRLHDDVELLATHRAGARRRFVSLKSTAAEHEDRLLGLLAAG